MRTCTVKSLALRKFFCVLPGGPCASIRRKCGAIAGVLGQTMPAGGWGRGGSAWRSLLHLALLHLHGRPATRARTHHELTICLEIPGDARTAAQPPV